MSRSPRTIPSPQSRREASEWLISLREREGDERTRRYFNAWLRQSPENVHAFLRMTALWEDTGLLKDSKSFDLGELLERAAQSSNVIELEPPLQPPPQHKLRRPLVTFAVAASVLLLILGLISLQLRKDTYLTETGEQRTVALPDGSSIVLNAKSQLRVRFSKTERNVDLLEGQAIFRVAHNPTRPFIVHSGATHVRAVGTQFDVYRQPDGTIVTVLEGTVAVRTTENSDFPAPSLREDTLLVTAGQQITVSPRTVAAPQPADIAAATAWSQGKLIFHETPLPEVIAQFNRYSSRRLVIEDPRLRQFHVSGIFPSSDPSRVAELLHQRFGATVAQSDDEIRVSR